MNLEDITLWNKPDIEQQILWSLTYMWNLKAVELWETVEWWLSWAEGKGSGMILVISYKLPVIRWISFRDIM